MVTTRNPGKGNDGEIPKRRTRKRVTDKNENPLNHSPFQGQPWNPAHVEQDILQSLSLPAAQILSLDQHIFGLLADSLGNIASNLSTIEDKIKLELSKSIGIPQLQLMRVTNDITNKLTNTVHMAGEQIATGMQQPILASDYRFDPRYSTPPSKQVALGVAVPSSSPPPPPIPPGAPIPTPTPPPAPPQGPFPIPGPSPGPTPTPIPTPTPTPIGTPTPTPIGTPTPTPTPTHGPTYNTSPNISCSQNYYNPCFVATPAAIDHDLFFTVLDERTHLLMVAPDNTFITVPETALYKDLEVSIKDTNGPTQTLASSQGGLILMMSQPMTANPLAGGQPPGGGGGQQPPNPPEPKEECIPIYTIDVNVKVDDLFSFLVNPQDLAVAVNKDMKLANAAGRITFWTFYYPMMLLLAGFTQAWKLLVEGLIQAFGKTAAAFTEIGTRTFIVNLCNTVALGALDKPKRISEYASNFEYPIGLPTSAEAGGAWLANEITDCQFEVYVKSNDNKFDLYKEIVKSGKFKFSALELMTLYKRDAITRGKIGDRLRELGSLEPEDQDELEALFEQVPGPSDIIRFMVRDAANEDTVKHFNMDKGFGENYIGQLKDWGEQQGIPDELAKFFWRAHWNIPSPTQLYEFYHRHRHSGAFGNEAAVFQDVKDALFQQDILPYWIDRMLAISFHPLTRTDLFRAYEHGWIDDNTFIDGMYQNGYSDTDSQTLLRFVQGERILTIKNSTPMSQYLRGFMSDSQLLQQMHDLGYEPTIDNTILDIGTKLRAALAQEDIIKGVNHQYKLCRIDDAEYTQILTDAGIDSTIAKYQLDIIRFNTNCASRHETALALCQALDQGIVTPEQYLKRMAILRYDDVAANRYLELCVNKRRAREAKAAAAEAKAVAQAQAKAEAAATKAANQAAAQIERQNKAATKLERARQTRNRILEAATAKVGQTLGLNPFEASDLVTTTYELIKNTFNLSQMEAANTVNLVANQFKGPDAATYKARCTDVARASLTDPFFLFSGDFNLSD
jgi:hypothetical protein